MRNKIFSKVVGRVVVMSMALVMLFSVPFFGAGHCVMYDPRVAELQRRIEELEEENRLQAERVAELEREIEANNSTPPCPILAAHKASAIVALQDYAFALGEKNFTRPNWAMAQEIVADETVNIIMARDEKEVDSVLARAKDGVGGVDQWDQMGREWGFSECLRFALSIELDKDEVAFWNFRDGDISDDNIFNVSVVAKNLAGYSMYYYGRAHYELNHKIFQISARGLCHYNVWQWFTSTSPAIPPFELRYFEKDSYIEKTFSIGHSQDSFRHRQIDINANIQFISSLSYHEGFYGKHWFPYEYITVVSNKKQIYLR